jgi:3-hydroxyisobutyrate dehydrogenase-like beta-hydroxyacid dehydrogenase
MAIHVSVIENYKKDLEFAYAAAKNAAAALGLTAGFAELVHHLKKNKIPHQTHNDKSTIPAKSSYYSFEND